MRHPSEETEQRCAKHAATAESVDVKRHAIGEIGEKRDEIVDEMIDGQIQRRFRLMNG